MRVLITNVRLGGRGGTETFVRDLARGLQNLGHSVIAYTADPYQQERLLENDVIPVATDLENLPIRPDVIHGQHHLEAMTAILSLPGVPAIYHCHGATWRGCSPRHPRIYHYVAVSDTLAERMTVESNIAPSDITVVLNGVDLTRFRVVRTPPLRLARGLVFNGQLRADSETIAAIRESAGSRGLDLDFAGRWFGRTILDPPRELPEYDVVFASGLSAIEALACGCAVVILGRTTCGPLVRPDNYEHLKRVNYSIAVNSPPPSAERVGAELDRYQADDCRATCARVRHDSDFRASVDTLMRLYEEVIDRHRTTVPDALAESLATAQYFRTIAPLVKMTDLMLDGRWSSPTRPSTFDELSAEVALLQTRIQKART